MLKSRIDDRQAVKNLLNEAAENPRLLTRLRVLCSQNERKRLSLLNMYMKEMKLLGEPEELITAFKCVKNEEYFSLLETGIKKLK